MNDPDEDVRLEVGQCFQELDDNYPLDELWPFIFNFIEEAAGKQGAESLFPYLASLPIDEDEYDLVLRGVGHFLNSRQRAGNRGSLSELGNPLVKLTLDIERHSEERKSEALTVLEHLARLNIPEAREALSKSERR